MRASVSGTASNASVPLVDATTVRQTPSIAIESPSAAVAAVASIDRAGPSSNETTRPTSRIRPVNMPTLTSGACTQVPGTEVALVAVDERLDRLADEHLELAALAGHGGARARPELLDRLAAAGGSSSVPISSSLRRSSSLPSWRVSQWLRCVTSWSSARWEASGVVDIRFEEHVVAHRVGPSGATACAGG